MRITLVPIKPAPLPVALAETLERAQSYANRSKAEETKRSYKTAWADFASWCRENGLAALPASPSTIGLWMAARAGAWKVSTLCARLKAVRAMHVAQGYHLDTRHPAIRETLAGIRRVHGAAEVGKEPILTADIKAMIAKLPNTLIGQRDGALLLLGFAGAFRRSELVALEVSDLAFGKGGVTVTLRRSKTDQEGQGAKIGIPYGKRLATCPVRALQEWIEAADLTDGRVFRSVSKAGEPGASLSDKVVALIVKRHAEAVGLDPAKYAGHSLRAGLATSAAASDVAERVIMKQTCHKSAEMVRRYIREADLFKQNAAAAVGL